MTVADAPAAAAPAIVSKGAPWRGLEQKRAGGRIDLVIDPLVNCLQTAPALTPATSNEMGEQGRIWMDEEFSWRRLGQQMADTYRWILVGGIKPGWVIET